MQLTRNAIQTLLNELIDGPSGFGCWVINRDEPGLLGLLSKMSAAEASRPPGPERKSIAAHVKAQIGVRLTGIEDVVARSLNGERTRDLDRPMSSGKQETFQ